MTADTTAINVTGVVKDGPPREVYVLVYSDDQRWWAVLTALRWCYDERLSFSEDDAAKVCREIERCTNMEDEEHERDSYTGMR